MTRETLTMRQSGLPSIEHRALSSRIDALITRQKRNWRLLCENLRRCSLAETKTILLGDFAIVVQCNSDRIRSTMAKADQAFIQKRPCQLCAENLFAEQENLAYNDHWVILCNPYPILDRHLSIVERKHVAQAIHGRLPAILELARDLTRDYFVFYNGPQCGASTPEHFHLQACARQALPVRKHLDNIESNATLRAHKRDVACDEGIEVFALRNYYASLLIYRGANCSVLTTWIERTLQSLTKITGTPGEPLFNLVVMFDDPGWTVCLFPRGTHRPSCFPEGTLTVSPASLDMAGWLVAILVPKQANAEGG